MTRSAIRWWDLFFGGTMAVVAIMVSFTYTPTETQRFIGWGAILLMVIAWVAIGRRSAMPGTGFQGVFAAVFIVCSTVVVACSPNSAVVQAIVFPLLWCVLPRTRTVITANIVLTVLLGGALWYVTGMGWDSLLEAVLIEGLSLGGSLGIGTWISRISDLSDERKRLLDELTAAQKQLTALSRDAGAASERERLARDIHDTIAQSLTGLVMLSQRAQRELAAGDIEAVAERLDLMEEGARDALVETRSLVAAGAPVELGGGIVAALERLGARFARETGIAVAVSGLLPELDRDTEVVLLRCAQEALANVRKHSGARSATIAISLLDGRPTMTVRDDGIGFDPSHVAHGFGLTGMRDRLALVGGALEVDGRAGTTVRVTA
jgi:signal transduction histidine kinase